MALHVQNVPYGMHCKYASGYLARCSALFIGEFDLLLPNDSHTIRTNDTFETYADVA